jgi:glycerate kinase
VKIVVAPNALKGALSAHLAAEAIARGLLASAPNAEVVQAPIADGGDGTAEVLVRATGGQFHTAAAHDALGRAIEARYGVLGGGRAVVDVAAASGLWRLNDAELDVFSASSYGTGELVLAALTRGAREVLLGVGGSATVDGGLGLLRALGIRALDARGEQLPDGARSLEQLASFDVSGLVPEARSARFTLLCDVEAELPGALAFAPQKGARSGDLPALESGLAKLGRTLAEPSFAGAGAAGGIAASLHALLGANVVLGSDFVLDAIDFDRKLSGATLVISAEGRFDAQSALNKGPVAVARRALLHGVPTLVLAGAFEDGNALADSPVAAVASITRRPCELDYARSVASDWLALTAEQTLRIFILGQNAARAAT